MNKLLFLPALLLLSCQLTSSPKIKKPLNLPDNYKLLYSQNFDKADSFKDFKTSNPKQWKLSTVKENQYLECTKKHNYKPKHRSPYTISLIKERLFSDFVLEVDLLQTGKNYGHRDMCVFFNFTDPDKYYYVHMAAREDPHAHNIMIVNDKPRVKISTKTTKGIDWGEQKWHKIKIERTTSDGTIKIFFDNMKTPIMLAEDTTFKLGHIGFGTFDDSGCIDNIRIWGPKVVTKKTDFFNKEK